VAFVRDVVSWWTQSTSVMSNNNNNNNNTHLPTLNLLLIGFFKAETLVTQEDISNACFPCTPYPCYPLISVCVCFFFCYCCYCCCCCYRFKCRLSMAVWDHSVGQRTCQRHPRTARAIPLGQTQRTTG
jgi:hypothetical protein